MTTNSFASLCQRVALGLLLSVGAADAAPDTYAVSDPRPLWKCATLLEAKHGWRITYEDPPLERDEDLSSIASATARVADPSAVMLIPKVKSFVFTFGKPQGREPSRQQCVDKMADDYGRANLGMHFRTLHQGDISHIIAADFKGRNGATDQRPSLLDTVITFPAQDRTLDEIVTLILKMVTDQTGAQIALGNVPVNLMNHHVGIGAPYISARDALILAFDDVSAEALSYGLSPIRISWALLYQADQRTCYFNAHAVGPGTESSMFGGH